MNNSCMTEPTEIQQLVGYIQIGNFEKVKEYIIDRNISAKSCDGDLCSLLHWAAINNRVEIAKFLISHGAAVNFPGGVLNEIPLQWAARNDMYTHMIRLLVDKGSDLLHKNVHGHDALSIACQVGNINIVYILLV